MKNEEFLMQKLFQAELCAITFLKEYVQFNFDGPILNFYEFPLVGVDGKWIGSKDPGYFDCVCNRIGSKVISVEEVPDIRISLAFDDGSSVQLSLRPEDRSSIEAAMFQAGGDNGWIVW